jgi:hypothetical protein
VWSSSRQNERYRNKFRLVSSVSVPMAEHSPMPVVRPVVLITPGGSTQQRVGDLGDIQILKATITILIDYHKGCYSPSNQVKTSMVS